MGLFRGKPQDDWQPEPEPVYTKEEKLIARLSLINALNKEGQISDEQARFMTDVNLDEYHNGSLGERLLNWVNGTAIKKGE